MGKKNKCGGNGNNSGNSGGGGEKKEETILTVVLKLDLHCEGCATKIKRYLMRSFQGVEVVKGGDGELTKLTVIGKVDPSKLRQAVEEKVKRKVELISPVPPKKENNAESKKGNQNCKIQREEEHGGGGQGEKKRDGGGEKKGGGGGVQKPKELPVTMAVMKLQLHCLGCIKKVLKVVTKTKGYLDISIDEGNDQITVKGAMDMKAVAESLSSKLKRKVEIVPPKKDGEKKEKENSGCAKGKAGGGNEEWEYQDYPPLCGYEYGYTVYPVYAPQMFSDENPNACSIM